MKLDLTGRELSVGDHVIVTHFWKGSGLGFARITRIEGGCVEISYPWTRNVRNSDEYILKVNREDYPAQFSAMDGRIALVQEERETQRQHRAVRQQYVDAGVPLELSQAIIQG